MIHSTYRFHALNSIFFGLIILFVSGCMASENSTQAQTMNGFDVSDATVPVDKIKKGGPPRDGIPSIDDPRFQKADDADWLNDDDRVLGIKRNGEVKAYPIRIMDWHEVANDTFGDEHIAVTWCPLCGSGMAFKSKVDGKFLELGVSGLLYNSDVLLYDRQTESLWSQISTEAITGEFQGSSLEQVPMEHTSWKSWRERHEDTRVLSRDTGHDRNYDRDPYADYEDNERLYFPVTDTDDRFDLKEWVMGITVDDHSKAYAFSELEKADEHRFQDQVGSKTVTIDFDAENESATAYDEEGNEISTLTAFWFAWYAFHPDTEVFEAGNE